MALSTLTLSALVVGCGICLFLWVNSSRHSSLPPGPPSDPILGHLRVIPTENQVEIFHSWAKLYGDVIQLRVPRSSIVILDSVQAATDLLDKSGANFSCRPVCKVFELMGWVPNLVFLQYGPRFIRHRRLFQRYFRHQEIPFYHAHQEHEAHILIKNLLDGPESYDECFRRFSTAIVIKIAYGHEINSNDDDFLKTTGEIGTACDNSGPVGNTPIDWLPILEHFPSWFPGTYYANHARAWRSMVREKIYDGPVEEIQRKMANGAAPPSVVTSALTEASDNKDSIDLDDIKGVAGTMYAAGVDTTWSTLGVFLVAMLLHPQCQCKAQEEIDSVIGPDRLPQFGDRESLPYTECIVQEVLRWYPVVPLGIPHRSLREETYRDMFIPKGSVVFANIFGMSRNENIYSEPEKFKPERFLAKPGVKSEPYFSSAFGFGRRVCPGQFLADASLWIAIARTLATLDLLKATDETGKEITPKVEATVGAVHHLNPVPCVIRARSARHEALVNECPGNEVACNVLLPDCQCD